MFPALQPQCARPDLRLVAARSAMDLQRRCRALGYELAVDAELPTSDEAIVSITAPADVARRLVETLEAADPLP